MVTLKAEAWSDPDSFVKDPELLAKVLRAPGFTVGTLAPYLDALEKRSGRTFPVLKALAEQGLSFQSGQEHLGSRRLVAPFLAASVIAGWAPVTEQAVAAALERLAAHPEPDLVRDFVEPAFLGVMRSFIGCTTGADDRVLELARVANAVTHPMLPLSRLTAIETALSELLGYLAASPVAAPAPGEPVSLVAFLEGRRPHFPAGFRPEYFALAVLVGGLSMAQSLGFALYGMLSQPLAVWQDAAAPGWGERSLERIISLYPSTLTLVRMPTDDVEVGGCPFHRGEPVVLDVVAANAKLRREASGAAEPPHVSFGVGAHKCPGSELSRLFLSRAIPALAKAYPRLALHKDRATFYVSSMVQYPSSLPCERDGRTERRNARLVDVKDIETARAIVNDDVNWSPPTMEGHLRLLAEKTGRDLSSAIRIARNAMFFMSGERHADCRRAVAECLGENRLARWQPVIDACVQAALDGLAAAERPDLIHDFADPLFRAATHPILGIRPRDPARFDALAPILQDVLEPWLPVRELGRLQEIFAELLDGMEVADEEGGPAPSLLGHLLRAGLTDFDEDDCKSLVLVLYGASFNLAHTLGNVLHYLLTLPPEDRALAHDPQWVQRELDGLISLCASPKYIYRMARRDTAAGDLPVRENETVRIQLLSVNRGTATGNLAFGHGLHRCVGAALSKRLLRSAIPALFGRFPDLALPPQQHEYFTMSQTVALARLPCRL